ncbi:FAD-dependent oxidoreductase [Paralimibaculum aggregatum]|uniref:FAD-dependent oxidoreductase n=1 Tax=Paralimibaculum aggregatum TaxID=3036245 RepID=A0ABQ6LMP0_9RHOB|nr:FAD-binding oxidoreductase [Limibaculum sp. NKW23]GMG81711.1 FAD-dependent oxidoreductase [Limibaculum sp. NKW23]
MTVPAGWAAEPAHPAYDVAIIGGGIMGASTAWHIVSDPGFRGRVLVVERDPSYAHAATSHTNSCIRQQFSTEINIRISQAGLAFIRDFPARIGDPRAPRLDMDGFGYLYLAATEARAEALRAAHAVQAACGVGARLYDRAELAERFPWMVTDDILLASHNPGDEGYFDGGTMFDWFRRKARDLGAEFVAAEVAGLLEDGRRITGLRLASGTAVAAGQVVNAAGTRSPRIAAMAGRRLPIEPRRRYTVVFEAERPAPEQLPLVIDPSGVHVRSDGAQFMCGYGPEGADPAADPEDFAWADPFEDRAWPAIAARIPAFERLRVGASWVGHYDYNTLDQNAIIGRDPERPGLIHLCGFSGHGLQQSPAMGRGVAELVVHGGFRSLDLSPLGVERVLEGRALRERAVI